MNVQELIEKLEKLIEDNPNIDVKKLEVTLAGQEYSTYDVKLDLNVYNASSPVVDIY